MGVRHLVIWLLLVAGFPSTGTGQSSPVDAVQNIRAFAKLYGYVRWFHPSDEAASLDWNRFAVYGARRVQNAEDAGELQATLEELFLPVAPSLRIYQTGSGPIAASSGVDRSPDMNVVAWQHRGVDLGGSGPFRSIRLHRPDPSRPAQGVVYQAVEAERLRGREIRLSANARLARGRGSGQLGLLVQVHGERGRSFSDDMGDRPITSSDWARYTVTGHVDDQARTIIFGAILRGAGTGQLDDLSLEVREDGSWRPIDAVIPGFEARDPEDDLVNWELQSTEGADHDVRLVAEGEQADIVVLTLEEEPLAAALFPARPALGEATDAALGRGLRALVPLALATGQDGTLPKTDIEKRRRLRQALDSLDGANLRAGDPGVRAAGVIVTWNVLQHFFPYFDAVDADWELVLTESLSRVLRASDVREVLDVLNRMLYHLGDAHAHAFHPILLEDRGLPLRVHWIEGRPVVVASSDTVALQPGDVVLSIDGTPGWQWVSREAGLLSGSRRWRRRRALTHFRGFGKGAVDTEANLRLVRGDQLFEVSLKRTSEALPAEARPGSFTELVDGVLLCGSHSHSDGRDPGTDGPARSRPRPDLRHAGIPERQLDPPAAVPPVNRHAAIGTLAHPAYHLPRPDGDRGVGYQRALGTSATGASPFGGGGVHQ